LSDEAVGKSLGTLKETKVQTNGIKKGGGEHRLEKTRV